MRIYVKAKTRSRKPGVFVVDSENLIVAVKEAAVENKANFAILEAVANHFAVSLGQVRLIAGRTNIHKIIEVEK